MLAVAEFSGQQNILCPSDQSDGFYFLKHTFPTGLTVTDVFVQMTAFIRRKTRVADAEIREKPIPLPDLPALVSRPRPAQLAGCTHS